MEVGNNANCEVSKDGKTLTIRVDLTKEFGKSKSGKTMQIASTLGNAKVAENVFVGLNVYHK
jgi:hypothetical protein